MVQYLGGLYCDKLKMCHKPMRNHIHTHTQVKRGVKWNEKLLK